MRTFFTNKPKQPPITDTHELLRQIEQKDAAFRVTQFVFFVVALAFLGTLLVATYRLQSSNAKLIQSQSEIIKNQSTQITQQKNELSDLKTTVNTDAQQQQKYIQCLVNLSFVPKPVTQAQVNACEAGNQIPPQANNSASSSGGATGSTKSGLSSGPAQTNTQKQTPATSNNPGGSTGPPPQTGKPTPGPLKKLTCKITLGLVCLK